MSIDQARDVIDEITKGTTTPGKIPKKTFVDYILPKQKEQLLQMDDSMEDLRELFQKFCSKQGGFGEQKLLNKASLK